MLGKIYDVFVSDVAVEFLVRPRTTRQVLRTLLATILLVYNKTNGFYCGNVGS